MGGGWLRVGSRNSQQARSGARTASFQPRLTGNASAKCARPAERELRLGSSTCRTYVRQIQGRLPSAAQRRFPTAEPHETQRSCDRLVPSRLYAGHGAHRERAGAQCGGYRSLPFVSRFEDEIPDLPPMPSDAEHFAGEERGNLPSVPVIKQHGSVAVRLSDDRHSALFGSPIARPHGPWAGCPSGRTGAGGREGEVAHLLRVFPQMPVPTGGPRPASRGVPIARSGKSGCVRCWGVVWARDPTAPPGRDRTNPPKSAARSHHARADADSGKSHEIRLVTSWMEVRTAGVRLLSIWCPN